MSKLDGKREANTYTINNITTAAGFSEIVDTNLLIIA
jgi:hypothetical protein